MKIIKKRGRVKRIISIVIVALLVLTITDITVMALSDDETLLVKSIVGNNQELFNQSSLWEGMFRWLGWVILLGLTELASLCATLFDKSFGMIDITQYKPVQDFLDEWQVVWVALICVSIAMLGVMLAFFWDKRPKVLINILVGVLVITSMSWIVMKLNTLIRPGVRNEIMGSSSSSGAIYDSMGTYIHDLVYLDNVVGLEHLNEKSNKDITYSSFSQKQMRAIDITETVTSDDVRDEADVIVNYCIKSSFSQDADGNTVSNDTVEEIYSGVAWTNFLSEYYYRFNVDWLIAIFQSTSLIIIYLFFSYKVVRTAYEVVWHELLAILYSSNLAGGQKILKILDSLKDCYIILILSVVSVKMYLLSVDFVAGRSWNEVVKAFFLIFIAFAVIDGPHLVQKITGQDVGLSDGMQKIMSAMYGSSAAMNVLRMGGAAAGSVAGGVGKAAGWVGKHIPKDESSGIKSALDQQAKNAVGGENNSPDDKGMDAGAELNSQNEMNSASESQNSYTRESDSNNVNNSDTGVEQSADAIGSLNNGMNMDEGSTAMSQIENSGGSAKEEALRGIDPGGTSGMNNRTDEMDNAIDNGGLVGFSSGIHTQEPIDSNSKMFDRNANPSFTTPQKQNESGYQGSGNRIIDRLNEQHSSTVVGNPTSVSRTDRSINSNSRANERRSNFNKREDK